MTLDLGRSSDLSIFCGQNGMKITAPRLGDNLWLFYSHIPSLKLFRIDGFKEAAEADDVGWLKTVEQYYFGLNNLMLQRSASSCRSISSIRMVTSPTHMPRSIPLQVSKESLICHS
jgi:hypothetical protein